MSRLAFKEGSHGFLCTAIGTEYLEMAYLQALNIKLTQQTYNKYAVVTDIKTYNSITFEEREKYRKVFDWMYTVETWSFASEPKILNRSPWKYTMKVDADLLFVDDIKWMWKPIKYPIFTKKIVDFRGDTITSRWHRKLFDVNYLPDIYTALMYANTSNDTFDEYIEAAEAIAKDWSWYATEFLKYNQDLTPRDDEIFSIALALMDDPEYLNQTKKHGFTIAHLKEPLNDLPANIPWHEQIYFEHNNDNEFWIGTYQQLHPIHYCSKTFKPKDLLEKYERDYQKLLESNPGVQGTRDSSGYLEITV